MTLDFSNIGSTGIILKPKAWVHTSPSQVKTARRCWRRWFYEKLAGVKTPPHPAAELGTRTHSWMEHILKRLAVPPGVGPLWDRARSVLEPALVYLPKPHPDLAVEVDFRIPTPFIDTIGRIDIVEPGRAARWLVTDLKTIGTLQYAVTEDELRMDVQCATYIKALDQEDRVDTAEFRFVYAQTSAPGTREVRILITRTEMEERWASMLETIRRQKEMSTVTNINDVPTNENACRDFGGCPFLQHCSVGKTKGLFSFVQAIAPQGVSLFAPFVQAHRTLNEQSVNSIAAPEKSASGFFDKQIEQEIDMSLVNAFSPETITKMKAALVAAGHKAEFIEKLNVAALAMYHAQLEDPVNPPDGGVGHKQAPTTEPAQRAAEGGGQKNETTISNPRELHWKAARSLLASLRGETFEVTNELIKAAGWTADDTAAEIVRLQGGAKACPIVPKVTAPPTTPAPIPHPEKASTAGSSAVGGKMHLWAVAADGMTIEVMVENNNAKIGTPLGMSVGVTPDASMAFLLQQVKDRIQKTIGQAVTFRQYDPAAPALVQPPPSTTLRADSVGVTPTQTPQAAALTKEFPAGAAHVVGGASTPTEPARRAVEGGGSRPRMTLKADLSGQKVDVALYSDRAVWLGRTLAIPPGTGPTEALKMVVAEHMRSPTMTVTVLGPSEKTEPPAKDFIEVTTTTVVEEPSKNPFNNRKPNVPEATGAPQTVTEKAYAKGEWPPCICADRPAGSSHGEKCPHYQKLSADEAAIAEAERVMQAKHEAEQRLKDVERKADGRCVVYVDCAPSFPHTRLETILMPFQQNVEATEGAFYFGTVLYNRGPALVAAELQKALSTGALVLPEHIVVNSFMPSSLPALEVLFRYARFVVRASK